VHDHLVPGGLDEGDGRIATAGGEPLPPALLAPDAQPAPAPGSPFEVLSVSSARVGDVHTVALSGELDLASVDCVERELLRAEAGDAAVIVLDIAGLQYIDLSGVRVLLDAELRSHDAPGRLRIRRGSEAVQRVVELCGVAHLLPFVDQ
jgi:anti-anti-sigma factor